MSYLNSGFIDFGNARQFFTAIDVWIVRFYERSVQFLKLFLKLKRKKNFSWFTCHLTSFFNKVLQKIKKNSSNCRITKGSFKHFKLHFLGTTSRVRGCFHPVSLSRYLVSCMTRLIKWFWPIFFSIFFICQRKFQKVKKK